MIWCTNVSVIEFTRICLSVPFVWLFYSLFSSSRTWIDRKACISLEWREPNTLQFNHSHHQKRKAFSARLICTLPLNNWGCGFTFTPSIWLEFFFSSDFSYYGRSFLIYYYPKVLMVPKPRRSPISVSPSWAFLYSWFIITFPFTFKIHSAQGLRIRFQSLSIPLLPYLYICIYWLNSSLSIFSNLFLLISSLQNIGIFCLSPMIIITLIYNN